MKNNRFMMLLTFIIGLAACDPGPPIACVQALPALELYVGESNQVSPCFDSEALPLNFEAETSDPDVISAEVFGPQVRVTAEGVGNAVITITAIDNNNLRATQTASVTVPNQPPVLKNQFQYEAALWSKHEVDLSWYIEDPDHQQLSYRVSASVVKIELEVEGNILSIYGRTRGEVEIEIVATDPKGDILTHAGRLTIGDPRLYITQAAHSMSRDVPLLMNKDGLLRAFLTTDSIDVVMPAATAVFYDGTLEIHRVHLDNDGTTIPERFDESTFHSSYRAGIDGVYIKPGVRLVIEFEPTGVTGIEQRIEMPLDVIALPRIEWTLIPIIIGDDQSAVQHVERIIADPETHSVFYHTRNALPVFDYSIKGHEPIDLTTNQDDQYDEIMPKLLTLWETEGRNGYYMGILPHSIAHGVIGAAFIKGRVAYSIMSSKTMAHEIGHNLSLFHAPACGVRTWDPNYPYTDGVIGIWGYDVHAQLLKRPMIPDLMSYCRAAWISDYSWRLAILHRHSISAERQQSRGRPGEMLTVWGWVDENGPILNPSMYVDGRPTPLSGDSHSIEMRTDQGEVISYRFGLQEIMDGPGGSAFSHLIPVTWSGELVEIRLEGPEGIAWLDASTDQPYSMVIRDGMVEHLGAGEYRAQSGELVIFSRGIPIRREAR